MNRRGFLGSSSLAAGFAGLAWKSLLAPVEAHAADLKPIRIKDVETFRIEIPASATEVQAGVMNRIAVTRVITESGARGYAFSGGGGGGRTGTGGRGGTNAAAGGGRFSRHARRMAGFCCDAA